MSRAALERFEKTFQSRPVPSEVNAVNSMNIPIMPTLSSPYLYPSMYPPNSYSAQSGQAINLVQPMPYYGGNFAPEVQEEVEEKKTALPMHGNTTTFNINNLLHQNIMESDYFRALYQLRTYHEVIDEINISVKHVEPWQAGTTRSPSSAFCLLLKFMLMKLTYKQMKGLLDTGDCPYVRAIGFLYLRYTCPPKELFKWYEPYLEDEEEFSPSCDPEVTLTMGKYLIKLLTEMQYYGTTLPRIPVPIERRNKVLLLLLEERKKRRRANMRFKEKGLFRPDTIVKAIYQDDANEPAWYEAKIDSIDDEETHKYWVTFTEYGNTELVDLGDIQLDDATAAGAGVDGEKERSRSRSQSRERGGRDRDREREKSRSRDRDRDRDRDRRRGDSRDRDRHRDQDRDRDRERRERSGSRDRDREKDRDAARDAGGAAGLTMDSKGLMDAVMRSSRDASTAVGKNYAQRPASYKGSLSLKLDRYTVRKKSRSRSPARRERRRSRDRRQRSRSPSPVHQQQSNYREQSREQLENLKKLREKYGDASAKG